MDCLAGKSAAWGKAFLMFLTGHIVFVRNVYGALYCCKNSCFDRCVELGFFGVTVLFGDYFGIGRRLDPVEYVGADLLGIPAISTAVYILVGFAAVIVLVTVSNRRGLRDTG